MQILTTSHKGGHGAKGNEDACIATTHTANESCHLCVIADGQGGQRGGATAAQLACTTVIELAQTYSPQKLIWQRPWKTILQSADQAIKSNPDAGLTTLTALCIYKNWIVGGSSGDNEAILYTSRAHPRTLTAKQTKNPPVGSGKATFSLFSTQFNTSNTLLMVTDGVWKYAGLGTMHTAVQEHTQEQLIQQLEKSVRNHGAGPYKDDFTLILMEHHA